MWCQILFKRKDSCKYVQHQDQCWAKSLAPTRNFPSSYDLTRNLNFLTNHFPTSDNVNRNMLKLFLGHNKSNKLFWCIPNQIKGKIWEPWTLALIWGSSLWLEALLLYRHLCCFLISLVVVGHRRLLLLVTTHCHELLFAIGRHPLVGVWDRQCGNKNNIYVKMITKLASWRTRVWERETKRHIM